MANDKCLSLQNYLSHVTALPSCSQVLPTWKVASTGAWCTSREERARRGLASPLEKVSSLRDLRRDRLGGRARGCSSSRSNYRGDWPKSLGRPTGSPAWRERLQIFCNTDWILLQLQDPSKEKYNSYFNYELFG